MMEILCALCFYVFVILVTLLRRGRLFCWCVCLLLSLVFGVLMVSQVRSLF